MSDAIRRFLLEEEGLSAVEYAVAGGVIVVGLGVAFTAIGDAVLAELALILAEI